MDFLQLRKEVNDCKSGLDIIKAYNRITHAANEGLIDFYEHDVFFDILKNYEIALDYDT